MTWGSTGARRLSAAALAGQKYTVESERVVTRKELAAAARDAMKGLVLRPTLRLVLAELVGCWGEKRIQDRMMVWPSNDYIMQRTGLSERAVRYGIRGLVNLKLITPRDSANGKRFAVKRDGAVVEVYGFDLTPIYARCGEWTGLIAAQTAVVEARDRVYDEITICRRATEEALTALRTHFPAVDCGSIADDLEATRGSIPNRRAGATVPVLEPIAAVLRDLRAAAELLFYTAANDGMPCPHIETNNEIIIPNCNKEPSREAVGGESYSTELFQPSVQLVVDACPAIADYDLPLKTEVDLVAAGRYLRGSLGAHESAWIEAVSEIGPVRAAIVVAITLQLYEVDVAQGINKIKNPGGYFRAMVRLVAAGRMNLQTELLAMKRRKT